MGDEGPKDQRMTFAVQFQPVRRGKVGALVLIRSNDPDENPYVFEVAGRAYLIILDVLGGMRKLLIPSGDESPRPGDGTDFGRVAIGNESPVHTFTLLSRYGDPYTYKGIAIEGENKDDFSRFKGGVPGIDDVERLNIELNEPFEFKLYFIPKGQGLRKARVVIKTNAPGSPYTFAVQGEGIQQHPE
jgi:hypothetical protein